MFYSFSPSINSNPYNKLNTSSRYLNNSTQLYPATKYLINKQEQKQQERKQSQDLFDIAVICNLEARTYEDSIAIDTINYYFRKLDTKYNMKYVLEQLQLLDNLINYITEYLQQGSSRTSQANIQKLEQSNITQQSIQSSQFQQYQQQQEFYSLKDNNEQEYIFSNLSPNFNSNKQEQRQKVEQSQVSDFGEDSYSSELDRQQEDLAKKLELDLKMINKLNK